MQAPATTTEMRVPVARPKYEKPRIQEMTEKEILASFQVTQAMATWWGAC